MLFNYPSFYAAKEQTPSELLFNSLRMLVQTHIKEIWFDLDFGSNIRNLIEQGIDNLVLSDIHDELEIKINKYFGNELIINALDVWQDEAEPQKVRVNLEYTELRTGIHKSLQSGEDIILNQDTSLY